MSITARRQSAANCEAKREPYEGKMSPYRPKKTWKADIDRHDMARYWKYAGDQPAHIFGLRGRSAQVI